MNRREFLSIAGCAAASVVCGSVLAKHGLSRVLAGQEAEKADYTLHIAPATVNVDTGNGTATLFVPGGPYAVTANSGGAPQTVSIATSPTAVRTISVSTDGGPLQITPAGGA